MESINVVVDDISTETTLKEFKNLKFGLSNKKDSLESNDINELDYIP